eukprot:9476542-Pyramimonas_sp.AAC.1
MAPTGHQPDTTHTHTHTHTTHTTHMHGTKPTHERHSPDPPPWSITRHTHPSLHIQLHAQATVLDTDLDLVEAHTSRPQCRL